MTRIFISYSNLDSEQAVEYYGALRRLAHEVWMDRAELKGGQEWLQVIQQQIHWSDTMVVIWSANALASVWVQTELQYAHALGKKIIPVRIDDTSPLEHMIVNSRQMVDARQHPLKDVVQEIQTAIEAAEQPGVSHHQVPLPKRDDRFPVKWIAGGVVALLALAVLLSLAITNLMNPPVTITVPPATIQTVNTAPTASTSTFDLNQPATIESLNNWRASEGLPALTSNEALQQVAQDHVSYLRSLPLSELEQTNLFRNADGQDAQFMAQEAGYSGTVQMLVGVTEGTVMIGDLLADIVNPAQFRDIGFRDVRSVSTGNQYLVMILGTPAE
jgi:hypothetical protein